MADYAFYKKALRIAIDPSQDEVESIQIRGVRFLTALLISACLAGLTVFLTEWLARGTTTDIGAFLTSPGRPGLAAVGAVFLLFLVADALLGRSQKAVLVLAPVALLLAFFSSQKQNFLSDPLYPSDLLFGRQIGELLPVMVAAQPVQAILIAVGALAAIGLLVFLWIYARRNFTAISLPGRVARLAIAVPLLLALFPLLDYTRFSVARDRLNMIPMMWDQQENYRHNGFLFAFAFNVPMSTIATPEGYSRDAMESMSPGEYTYGYYPSRQPDVIMVMSESLWDPTRLEGVDFAKDPMPVIRGNQSGHVFSPEFGGMTANVEFEALTGFSNAFLPYGSIPYQQYVRRQIPSLATFFRSKGYVAQAFHPFQSWFWNRANVYESFGFETFHSEENLPPMDKRGIFASDEALTETLIRQADRTDAPFFFFTVTLQGHGPYEANRYARNTVGVDSPLLSLNGQSSLATYSQGIAEADASLKRLMDWASKRRRETIIVLFGDHLPPLGSVYTETGYMPRQVATRRGPLEVMAKEHETPLVIWSSKRGVQKDIGSISPSQLPYHVVRLTGFRHPFYTGMLRDVQKRFPVIDRQLLVDRAGESHADWQTTTEAFDPLLANYRLLQHDTIFGNNYGRDIYFPEQQQLQPQPES